jgi:hypothetical protein
VIDPKSRRGMDVLTDAPGVQVPPLPPTGYSSTQSGFFGLGVS